MNGIRISSRNTQSLPLDPLTCTVCDQIFNNFIMSVEAGGSQGRRIGPRGAVDVGVVLHQQLHDAKVAGRCGAPERRGPLNRLAVEGDGSCLFHVRVAFVEQILNHIKVTVPTGDYEWRGPSRPRGDQSLNFLHRASMEVSLQRRMERGEWGLELTINGWC